MNDLNLTVATLNLEDGQHIELLPGQEPYR